MAALPPGGQAKCKVEVLYGLGLEEWDKWMHRNALIN